MSAYFKIITSCLLFGSVGLFIKNIDLASGQIVFFRTLLGGSFLLILALVRGEEFRRDLIKKNLPKLILAGLLLGSNWTLLYESYKYSPVSVATLLHYMAPVVVMILSPLMLEERLSRGKLIGIGLTLVGMVLVTGQLGQSSNLKMALVTGLGSALLYGLLIIINRKIEGLSGLVITIFQLYVAAMVMLIYSLLTGWSSFSSLDSRGLISLLILSFIHTGIGESFYVRSIQELGATSVALLSYIDPLSALVFSAIFLGERLSWIQILGGLLILGGALYGELRGIKENQPS